jgi:pimeloyl-ACP methyl ester carboxylesterase
MERLSLRHTVISFDYPPVKTIDEFNAAIDAILQTEGIHKFSLGGQSYGGLLAQAYLAYRNDSVEQLILSSSGPADYSKLWLEAINTVIHNDLSREDVISHFAVAADLIRKGTVNPAAYQNWKGRIIILSAENDPTQSRKDIPRYERLFGRSVKMINMGSMGHTAALFNPEKYVELLEEGF